MESSQDEIDGEGPFGRSRDVPLSIRFETHKLAASLRQQFGGNETVGAVCLALTAEKLGADRLTSYSRHKPHYQKLNRFKSPLYTHAKVVGAADYLAACGLIENHVTAPGARGRQSTMRATPELLERVLSITGQGVQLVAARPRELIILRDAGGVSVPFADTAAIRRMWRNLEEINEAIRSVDISHGASAAIIRIFNQHFGRCGRGFAVGGAFQSMPKELRRKIRIDGEEVVEIDYVSLHPTILYAQIGAARPASCYEIGNWPRGLVKVGLLILLNAGNHASARHAIAHHREMASVASIGSSEAHAVANNLIRDIKAAHSPIARFFHNDAGARLMAIDSQMAECVMLEMVRTGIVVLPIHDSFLVPASKAAMLEEAMHKAAYLAQIGSVELKRCKRPD